VLNGKKKAKLNWCNSAKELRVSGQEFTACGFLEAAFPHCLIESWAGSQLVLRRSTAAKDKDMMGRSFRLLLEAC
jgi:hypothetical protein